MASTWDVYTPADFGCDDEPPGFLGRCPKCGAFIANEPKHGPGGYIIYDGAYDVGGDVDDEGVYQPCIAYGAPRSATEEEIAAYDALRAEHKHAEASRMGLEPWGFDPYWPCGRCGHEATGDEVWA